MMKYNNETMEIENTEKTVDLEKGTVEGLSGIEEYRAIESLKRLTTLNSNSLYENVPAGYDGEGNPNNPF